MALIVTPDNHQQLMHRVTAASKLFDDTMLQVNAGAWLAFPGSNNQMDLKQVLTHLVKAADLLARIHSTL